MALGTNLTARDYLSAQRHSDELIRVWNPTRAVASSRHKGFSEMLNARLDKNKANCLTASDYLKNPVINNTIKKVADASVESILETRVEGPGHVPKQENASEKNVGMGEQGINTLKQPLRRQIIEEIEQSVTRAAKRYNLSPDLILGVIKAESGFQVTAVSSAGAKGLMQLMPATAKELGVEDSFDIGQNIDGGARYLRKMLDRFENDIEKALAAYNAGPGTVERYEGKVPYHETQQYVTRVLAFSGLKV